MRIEENKLATFFLGVLCILALGFVLHQTQTVILPLLIAWLISQLLGPAVVFFVRRGLPPGLAITIVMSLLVLGMYWLAVFVTASANQFLGTLPAFDVKFTQMTNDIIDYISPKLEGSNIDIRSTLRDELLKFFGSSVVFIRDMLAFTTNLITKLLLIVIMVAFMLVGKPFGDAKIRRALSPEMADRVQTIVASISANISQYLFIQFIISLITGVLIWFACETLGVPAAITWGALGFLLNFIPMIGSIIACIPPILLALLQNYPNYWPAVILSIALIAIQQIMGNIVSPKMMGDRLNLSPVIILLSLLFWGWIWGIPGALLSVVIAASMKIVCDNLEPLRPIGIMMEAGRVSARALEKEEQRTSRETSP